MWRTVAIALFTIGWSVPVVLAGVLRFRRLTIALCYRWVRVSAWLTGARVRVRQLAPLPSGAAIYMANHVSQIDILALMLAVPRPCTFIAKAELRRVPCFGPSLAAFGIVFVKRGRRDSAQDALASAATALAEGRPLVVFPEGTRGQEGGPLLPFKSGVFRLAQSARVPVVPVAIRGAGHVLPKHAIKMRPGQVEVVLGAALPPADFADMPVRAFAGQVRDAVNHLASVNDSSPSANQASEGAGFCDGPASTYRFQ